MFEQWKEKEMADVKAQYGMVRVLTYAVMFFMILSFLGSVIMLLDGGGAMELVVMAFQLAIIAFAWTMGDYKGRFIKPMLSSVEEVLPSQGEREEFARQMAGATELLCPPGPQVKPCPLWMGTDYSYFRKPRKSRVLKNRELRRAKLALETYTVGRGHARSCYSLYLFSLEEEKPVWNGCFRTEEEAYRTLEAMRPHLPANLELDDQIAYGKTEEGRKANRKSELIQIILAALLVVAMIVIAKIL